MGEEAASAFANALAEVVIARDKSEWIRDINGYRKEGYSQKEAVARAFGDQMINVGISAVGGFFSGAALGGMAVIADNTAGRIRAERNTRNIRRAEEDEMVRGMEAWLQERKTGQKNGEMQYTITEMQGKKRNYGKGVFLDTDVFDGVKPRDWGRVLNRFVYNNLAGSELTMYDENGIPESVFLAKTNDRVKKDGANNSHKVIDKLARYKGDNIRALATIHLSEALETSGNEIRSDEHLHQWMDENGWIYRTTYFMDKNGAIYEATLNIADGRRGKILYDINKIKRIDDGVVPSTIKGRGSLININSSGDIITQKKENVKPFDTNKRFSISQTLPRAGETGGVTLPTAKEQMEAAKRQRRAAEAKT